LADARASVFRATRFSSTMTSTALPVTDFRNLDVFMGEKTYGSANGKRNRCQKENQQKRKNRRIF
jgi:hypothetical protein